VPNHPPVDLVPHAATQDWYSIYPFSVFMTGFVTPAPRIPTSFMVPPEFNIVKDEFNQATNERHLILRLDYTGSEYSTLKFEAPHLLRWNLTDVLPPTPRGSDFLQVAFIYADIFLFSRLLCPSTHW